MSDETKLRLWEILIRVVAICIVPLSAGAGYQFKTLADADKASMRDRVELRERVAVNEAKIQYTIDAVGEIRATLIRIEAKLDRHSESDRTP